MKSARKEPGGKAQIRLQRQARVELRAREGRAGVQKCWPAVHLVASALGVSGRRTVIESQPCPGSLVPLAVGGGRKTLVPGVTASQPLLGYALAAGRAVCSVVPGTQLVRIGEAGVPVPRRRPDRVVAEVLPLLAHARIQLCAQRSVGG